MSTVSAAENSHKSVVIYAIWKGYLYAESAVLIKLQQSFIYTHFTMGKGKLRETEQLLHDKSW